MQVENANLPPDFKYRAAVSKIERLILEKGMKDALKRARAYVDAGADAIYAGLSKFNARERGENFTPDIMKKVVDHAHTLNKKVYLTLNTLLRETELPELLETLDINIQKNNVSYFLFKN